jgi:putative transposase
MHPAIIKYQQLPTVGALPTWQGASDAARAVAQSRSLVVKHILASSDTIDKALNAFKANLNHGLTTPALSQAVAKLGKLPGRATVYNWCNAYKAQGLEGLLPAYKGKTTKAQPWFNRALALYHAPNSPSFAQVADQLCTEGFKAEAYQVRRFIIGLPHELGPQSPWRIGAKLYREKHKDHLLRTTSHIPAGFIYNGDGHTIDVYLAHHNSGKPFRYELTAFQDVRSRCIVGWDLGEAENSLATMNALTESIKTFNHVPSMLYVDNGSGYKANMMTDECCGVYAQLDIETIFAIPGNARAKWIERFFLHMEDRVGKRFATYCGRDHDERHKQLMLKEVKQGKRQLPTKAEWIAEFEVFLHHYHNSEHPEEKGKTRLQVWEDNLVQSPPIHVDFDYLPRAKVNVLRGQIKLHKRVYTTDHLHQFNGKQLVAGYSMKTDKFIHLYELTGEFLCVCHLKTKQLALPESRVDERVINRLENQSKRLEVKRATKEAEAGLRRVVDVESVEAFAADTPVLEKKAPQTLDLNINDFLAEPEQCDAIAGDYFYELETDDE